jgi:hypothetical protein
MNPTRVVRWCSILIVTLVLACPAFSGIRPSFRLDYSSWHATHIVLVATTSTDGTFEVLDSWKGDLKVGQRVVVPELRPSSKAVPIPLYPKSWSEAVAGGVTEMIPKLPVGSRMILFLKSEEQHPSTSKSGKSEYSWKPADIFGEMKTSVLWIDGDHVSQFVQLMNPGPSVFFEFPGSEHKVRDRVIEIDEAQRELTVSVAESEGTVRAERLKPYVHSDILPARLFALEELGKFGPEAVPTILAMLDDPSFGAEADGLIKALVRAGGETVGEELNSRLRRELAFWKTAGPNLTQGWWNQDLNRGTPLRGRYSQTYELIIALESTHYSPARKTAIELRDLWRSLPQLNDPSGLNQIAEECDKLISQFLPN